MENRDFKTFETLLIIINYIKIFTKDMKGIISQNK